MTLIGKALEVASMGQKQRPAVVAEAVHTRSVKWKPQIVQTHKKIFPLATNITKERMKENDST